MMTSQVSSVSFATLHYSILFIEFLSLNTAMGIAIAPTRAGITTTKEG